MPITLDTPLVSVAWLQAHLAAPELVVLDASWYLAAMGRDAEAEFLAGHIPGARRFDLDAASDPRSSLPHMLPAPDAFSETLRQLGMTPASGVVVYDGSGSNLSAGRVWWMLRVFGHRAAAVLDGGLGEWRRAGLPLAAGPAAPAPAVPRYPVQLNTALIRSADEVEAWLAGGGQLADARPASRFTGDAAEPRPGLRSGHMPGARSLPWNSLVDADGLLLPLDQLRGRFAAAGLDPSAPMICSCGSGTSAGAVLLALAVLGQETMSLYDGSWSEWGADPARPVVQGPA